MSVVTAREPAAAFPGSPVEVLRAAAGEPWSELGAGFGAGFGAGAGVTGSRAVIGIDLVAVARVRDHLTRHGDRWRRDLLTPRELEGLGRRAGDPEAVAGRVAAKESVIKVLAPDDLVPWCDIEVVNGSGGAPVVRLAGRAFEWADRRHLRRLDVSIAHDAGWAVAIALGSMVTEQ